MSLSEPDTNSEHDLEVLPFAGKYGEAGKGFYHLSCCPLLGVTEQCLASEEIVKENINREAKEATGTRLEECYSANIRFTKI